MRYFLFLFTLFYAVSLFSLEKSVEEKNNLDGIYGDAGHIGVEFSLGYQNFEYYKLRDNNYLSYVFKDNIVKFYFKGAVTYFSTDMNRINFLFETNSEAGSDYFVYKSFSFGIIDKIYVNEKWSTDVGMTTVFKGSYKFIINLGVTYYFFKKRSYYWVISDFFNILLNSASLSNNLYISWVYIFQ